MQIYKCWLTFVMVSCFFSTLVSSLKGSALNTSESVVADVIKNISRINNILKELINNYEELQNNFKSQEIFTITTHTSPPIFPATTLGYSDMEDGNIGQYLRHDDNYKRQAQTRNKHKLTSNDKKKGKISDKEGQTSKSTEIIGYSKSNMRVKHPHHVTTDTTEFIQTESFKDISIDFVKGNKSLEELNGSGTETEKQNTNKVKKKTEKKKNRFEVVLGNERFSDKKHSTLGIIEDIDNSTVIKKKHTAGEKRKNSANSNMTKNSKKLATLDDRGQSYYIRETSQQNIIKSSDNDFRIGIYNETKKYQEVAFNSEYTTQRGHRETNDEDSMSNSNDDSLIKEMFKANILRKAYGDACLKLVVRKCYKALKKALIAACKYPKCRSAVKTSFDKNARTGCIQHFTPTNNTTKGNKDKVTEKQSESEELDAIEESEQKNFENEDKDDEDYLNAVCKPEYKSLPADVAAVSEGNVTETPLHLLRTKYEKACVKSSQKRCVDACKYGYTKACDNNQCEKRTVKKFNKACKRHCKAAFFVDKTKIKSGSDDSGSGGSDSGGGSSSGSSES